MTQKLDLCRPADAFPPSAAEARRTKLTRKLQERERNGRRCAVGAPEAFVEALRLSLEGEV